MIYRVYVVYQTPKHDILRHWKNEENDCEIFKHKKSTCKVDKNTARLLLNMICDVFVVAPVHRLPLLSFNLFEISRFIKGFQLTVPLIWLTGV